MTENGFGERLSGGFRNEARVPTPKSALSAACPPWRVIRGHEKIKMGRDGADGARPSIFVIITFRCHLQTVMRDMSSDETQCGRDPRFVRIEMEIMNRNT